MSTERWAFAQGLEGVSSTLQTCADALGFLPREAVAQALDPASGREHQHMTLAPMVGRVSKDWTRA